MRTAIAHPHLPESNDHHQVLHRVRSGGVTAVDLLGHVAQEVREDV